MASFQAKDIRNIIITGHSACGKTILVEALLYGAGAIPRMGTIAEGNTVSDYNEDEKEKKHSIGASLASFVYNGKKINLIDVPGSTDFVGDLIGGLRVADACLVVLNASSGIEFGTERAFKMAKERGVPCLVFVNMMDKEHADFGKCVQPTNVLLQSQCISLHSLYLLHDDHWAWLFYNQTDPILLTKHLYMTMCSSP